MALSLHGNAKVIEVYNVSRMEIEGLDISEFDLESQEDVKELFERVNEFVESGEVAEFDEPEIIRGVDPDECSIQRDEERLYPDEITLKNINIVDLIEKIQEAEVGEVFYIRSLEGDGVWDFDTEPDECDLRKLQMAYVDCSIFFDQYDVIREGYLDLICDTIVPEKSECEEIKMELSEFIFKPLQVYGQLYVVKKDPIEEMKILQKVDFGGRVLSGTDFIVDDFEAN